MRDLHFCLGEYGVQVADSFTSGGKVTQKLVTCLYRVKLGGVSRVVAVNWCKTLVGQGLSVNVDDTSSQCTCKVDMKPWFFWKRKGSKTFDVGDNKVEVFWDFSAAKYGSGPEPIEGFFLAVVSEHQIVLLLGNMPQEAYKKTLAISAPSSSCEASMISRREHIFGNTFYSTTAQFGENGRSHDISIECQTAGKEPRLCVRVDKQLVVQVKRLMWKFRGNQTIIVDGFPVELLWDVHNWLFNPNDGHAVFMFQTSLGSSSNNGNNSSIKAGPRVTSTTSLFQWHHHHSISSLDKDEEGYGFSLLLYAWKSE